MCFQLSEGDEEVIRVATNTGNRKNNRADKAQVVVRFETDIVTPVTLRSLLNTTWLNDEVMHAFYRVLSYMDGRMCEEDSSRKRSHFFKSLFLEKLTMEYDTKGECDEVSKLIDGKDYKYANVKSWYQKCPGKNIFGLNKLFCLIMRERMHWSTIVIMFDERLIVYLDSLRLPDDGYLQACFVFLQDEHRARFKKELPKKDDWDLIDGCDWVPRQPNTYDCGVYALVFAYFILLDLPLPEMNNEQLPTIRKFICLTLLVEGNT